MGGSLVFSNTRIIQFRVLIFFGKKKKAIPALFFSFFYSLLRARISSRGAQRARLHTHTKREREREKKKKKHGAHTPFSLFLFPFLFRVVSSCRGRE